MGDLKKKIEEQVEEVAAKASEAIGKAIDFITPDRQYYVSGENFGMIILRREPNLNLETKDGKDNAILSFYSGARVTLKSVKTQTNDGLEWYNIQYADPNDGIDETGWAALGALSETPLLGSSLGTSFSFKFGNDKYTITNTNLDTAQSNKYIFTTSQGNTEAITIGDKPYHTTATNIKTMKTLKLIS